MSEAIHTPEPWSEAIQIIYDLLATRYNYHPIDGEAEMLAALEAAIEHAHHPRAPDMAAEINRLKAQRDELLRVLWPGCKRSSVASILRHHGYIYEADQIEAAIAKAEKVADQGDPCVHTEEGSAAAALAHGVLSNYKAMKETLESIAAIGTPEINPDYYDKHGGSVKVLTQIVEEVENIVAYMEEETEHGK